jgi:hypothetical protein
VAGSPSSPRRGFAGVLRLVQFFAGLLTASLFFYLLGNALLSVDSAFHEAAIWHGKRLDQK